MGKELRDFLYYEDYAGKLYNGDVIELLKLIPDESIDCCITSPPYWGLRDYGNDNQIGLEHTPEEYVSKLVTVFEEVRRVLKKDGTLWLNLGDSYYGGGWKGAELNEHSGDIQKKHLGTHCGKSIQHDAKHPIIKTKDLVGIPWMVAFALRSAGWYLRQDIIWHKPNPMPESVTDRCTKSHEYIFLMSKSAQYYYDADAIKEIGVIEAGTLGAKGSQERASEFGVNARPSEYKIYDGLRNKRDVWTVTTKPCKEAHFATFPQDLIEPMIKTTRKDAIILDTFFGSGTTGIVAKKLGRKYIGIELNEKYCYIAKRRLENTDEQFELEFE